MVNIFSLDPELHNLKNACPACGIGRCEYQAGAKQVTAERKGKNIGPDRLQHLSDPNFETWMTATLVVAVVRAHTSACWCRSKNCGCRSTALVGGASRGRISGRARCIVVIGIITRSRAGAFV
jgi:hypothetical protein